MMSQRLTDDDSHANQIVRLVRIARLLEREKIYNAAKVFRAMAFSEEIRLSNLSVKEVESQTLISEVSALTDVSGIGNDRPELHKALQKVLHTLTHQSSIPWVEIPEVQVCRCCGEIVFGNMQSICASCGAYALTFRQFEAVYFLECLPKGLVVDALASAPHELDEVVSKFLAKEPDGSSPPGNSRVYALLRHLVAAQDLLATRLEKMLLEVDPALGVSRASPQHGETETSIQEILNRFASSRRATIERIRNIACEDWYRVGFHNEYGRVTILQQASYFAKHERHHMACLTTPLSYSTAVCDHDLPV